MGALKSALSKLSHWTNKIWVDHTCYCFAKKISDHSWKLPNIVLVTNQVQKQTEYDVLRIEVISNENHRIVAVKLTVWGPEAESKLRCWEATAKTNQPNTKPPNTNQPNTKQPNTKQSQHAREQTTMFHFCTSCPLPPPLVTWLSKKQSGCWPRLHWARRTGREGGAQPIGSAGWRQVAPWCNPVKSALCSQPSQPVEPGWEFLLLDRKRNSPANEKTGKRFYSVGYFSTL